MADGVVNISALGVQEVIAYPQEGEESKNIGSSFFRGATVNFNPYARDFHRSNFLEKFLLKGWIPETKVIDKGTRITAFGSCFAENITKHLSGVGYNLSKDRNPDIYISTMGEGLVNVHAIAQQFEWALENISPPEGLWHGFKANEFGYDEFIRSKTREAFVNTDFFVITLGLSEVWYDEVTGGIFWRAVPQANYDESRHKFRVCSFAETKGCIERIYELIRKHVPEAKVLFTLSPIPLAATFRANSCVTANSASKAILRAALDEFYRDNPADLNRSLFYFPSYEVISELFFAKYEQDGRHPHPEVIEMIMYLFEAAYCDSAMNMETVESRFKRLRLANARRAEEAATPREKNKAPGNLAV